MIIENMFVALHQCNIKKGLEVKPKKELNYTLSTLKQKFTYKFKKITLSIRAWH